jgi:hypothetical protein
MDFYEFLRWAQQERDGWAAVKRIRTTPFTEAIHFEWVKVVAAIKTVDVPSCECCEWRNSGRSPEPEEKGEGD